jgi:hypothetical protein
MDQDQQRVGRQRYIRREAFRSNLFGREILPQTKNSTPLFFISAIAFRFGLLVPNLAAIVIRNAAAISKTIATATQGNCEISAIYLLRGFAELAPPTL